MQALSGETGAGKSIVVDAVNLILGGRADRSLIRTGEDKASVEAIFDATGNPEAQAVLRREGIDAEDGLVLYREMTASGKNVCRVCGVMVSAGLLRELGTLLMDIHGQHEHQFLMDEEMQLRFLDRMGSAEHRTLMRKTEEACEAFLGVHRQYARMKRENDQKQRRLQELEADLKELHQARLKPGEEETLQQEGARLRNAEKIVSALRGAREALSYGENEASSLEKIKAAAGTLGSLGKYGETMKSLASRCENAYYELEEVAFEISAAMDSFDHDPGKLEKTEERLDLIRRLERKYGATLDEVISEQQKMEAEYEQLCSLEDRLAETAAEHKRLLAVYRGAARELSESRKAVARRFEQDMMAQLKDLGMEKTVFSVAFSEPEGERKPMPRPMGDDQTSFLISPNPGEPLKPLARIASGGELSRMMLALKALEAEGSGVDCMVFDEIDTGISGRMAQVVAEKMHAIARKRQVICVTHLPQIAAAADYEFLVEKSVENGRTRTRVTLLDREGRIQEVARMISGAEGSGSEAKAYARKMLEAGETVAAARHESE